jgi:hypothetical protein
MRTNRRTHRQIASFSALAICALLSFPSALPAPASVKTTLCSIAADPGKYDDQLVRITARYESDGQDREGLFDTACRESGVGLRFSARTKGTKKLQAAVRWGNPGTFDKKVIGTFVGVFHLEPDSHPTRWLDVLRIESISVKP